MLNANELADAFERNVQIIKRPCDGLTHEDSLRQTPFHCQHDSLFELVYDGLWQLHGRTQSSSRKSNN